MMKRYNPNRNKGVKTATFYNRYEAERFRQQQRKGTLYRTPGGTVVWTSKKLR